MLHTENEESNRHDNSERTVGIHVFLQIPKFNPVGSFIFFFSMISFGYVQKINWVNFGHFGKIVQFVEDLK